MQHKLADIGGVTSFCACLIMKAWNIFTEDPISTAIVTLTGICGLIYIIYKVVNERKRSKLLDFEMKEKGID